MTTINKSQILVAFTVVLLFSMTIYHNGHFRDIFSYYEHAGEKTYDIDNDGWTVDLDSQFEMADEFGMGNVAVIHSSHSGAMASMALKAARQGFIAFAFTHADSLLLSHNGQRPFFGTNPICMAVPRQQEEPYCLDMATSMISWNKLMVHRADGSELSENLAADSNGDITCSPEEATCLIPAGFYKGYGLASMVEILCGIFTGMNFGRAIPGMYTASMNTPRQLGQFYIVMRTDGCLEHEEFLTRMQDMTDQVRKEPGMDGEKVMLPGDPEIQE